MSWIVRPGRAATPGSLCGARIDDLWVGNLGAENRRRLIALLKRDALRLGSFTLASGKSSHYYVDGRKVTLSAEGAGLIALGILDLLTHYPDVAAVGGLTLGADPIVGATLALAPATAGATCVASSCGSRPRRTAPGASSRDHSNRVPRSRSSMTWRPRGARLSRRSRRSNRSAARWRSSPSCSIASRAPARRSRPEPTRSVPC